MGENKVSRIYSRSTENSASQNRTMFCVILVLLLCTQQVMSNRFTPLKGVRFDHVTYRVPKFDDASRFYQQLLQMPLVRHIPSPNNTDYLGVGGDNFFGLEINETAYIDHFCLGLETFDKDNVISALQTYGFTPTGISTNTMRFWDQDGIQIQLCNFDYADNQTWYYEGIPVPTSFKPLQAMQFRQVTIKVSNLEKSSALYQKLFGLPLLREVKGVHYLGVGDHSFLGIQSSGMSTGFIHSFCFGIKDYQTESMISKLILMGLKINSFAEDNIWFTDPFGHLMQICSLDYAD